jgi:hypothetical protein
MEEGMSRSGYSDDCEYMELYRGTVDRAIAGKRGQKFLQELADAMDAMPEKRLIRSELVTEAGEVCAIGSVCKARKMNVKEVDAYCPETVGALVNISRAMAAEIEYENDERGHHDETPEQRWTRMRKWVEENLRESSRVASPSA